jgi:hypothetical protein
MNNEEITVTDEVVDTPTITWRDRVGAVFGNAAPHGGFAKLILIIVIASVPTWYYFTSGEEKKGTTNNTEADEFVDRGKKTESVPEDVAIKEIKKDQVDARATREQGESFVGTRPNTGKKPLADLLNGMHKGDGKTDHPVVPDMVVDEKPKPPKNYGKTVIKPVTTTVGSKIKNKKTSNNPITDYILNKKDTNNSANKAFSNAVLVSYIEPLELEVPDKEEEAALVKEADDLGFLAHRAGYFLYGQSITAVNTDVDVKEVVGEIRGGYLSGARIIGTWSRLGNFYEDLSLVFTKMEFREEIYSVNLIAFSTTTSLPAFVSEVDRHLLYRWGGLLAGASLEAAQALALASAAISNPTATEALTNASTTLSGSDLENIFISAAGSEISDNLSSQFERPITSKIHVHQDMRLLSVEPIYIK